MVVIDNYDSFTYNLVQYFGELGAEMQVFRNDQITIRDLKNIKPRSICISPGPCTPAEAGISKQVIEAFGAEIPILGVCLGHQCMAEVFGAEVVRAARLMHGKTSWIRHDGEGLFQGLPSPLEATRYHSLIVKPETVTESIVVTAETAEGEIMGLRHRTYPVYGVQFHPESILTTHGKDMLRNFMKMAGS